MRDDSKKWAAALTLDRAPIKGDGVAVRLLPALQQTVLSGPIRLCEKRAGCTALGWPDMVTGDCYALRLRRDRILRVGGAVMPEGWCNGVAVSDISSGLAIVEISGARALDLLAQGGEIDPDTASASVSRLFHGMNVSLYRWQNAETYRLHLERGFLETLWTQLHQTAIIRTWRCSAP